MKRIPFYFLYLFIFLSIAVLFIGVIETTRNEFIFTLAEKDFMNSDKLPNHILEDYYEFKGDFIFTNEIYTTILNYSGASIILYIFTLCWRIGKESPTMKPKEIFNHFGIYLVLIMYIVGSVIVYVSDVLVNQLIKLLFTEIYSAVWVLRVCHELFWWLIIVGYLIAFLSNQIKYFSIN